MKRFLLLILIGCVVSCTKTKPTEQFAQFTRVSETETGIDFKNILTENDSLNYFTYGYMYMGGGVAAGDINNDGLIDLYFTGNMVPNKLFLNKGNFKFDDITEKSGTTGDSRWYTGVTMADVNHDGFLDIYCSVGGKFTPKENQLFVNQGDGTFKEKAREFGIANVGNSVQSTFFDYDRDGDLDLYVANYPPTPFNSPNHYYVSMQRFVKDHQTDILYRNDGDSFTDVTEAAGVRSFGLSLSATISDLNNDGWPDIYVSNDFSTPDFFYINNKNGTFSNVLKTATKNTSFYGMGADIADFNNDGLLDIFQADMSAKDNRRAKANMASMNPQLFWSTVNSGFHYQFMQNSLQLNNGNLNDSIPDFSNISRLAGVSSTDWTWGPLFADLDNDGFKDLFISNGTRREINNNDYFNKIENRNTAGDSLLAKSLAIPSEKIDNFVLKNNADLTFKRVNEDWGITYKGFSNGGVYVDLDNDGNLDIITNNIDDFATVFKNNNTGKNNYVDFECTGPEKNPFGLGVKVEIISQGQLQYQELTLSRGFQSSVAPRLHFGIGKHNVVDSIKVIWPDGKEQILSGEKANRLITLNYSKAVLKENIVSEEKPTLFKTIEDSLLMNNFRHQENYYNDFEYEILIPHKMSTLGPFVAVGDLNGDLKDDYVVGGAKNQETAIFIQTDSGFDQIYSEVLSQDKKSEDMGIAIFDADQDGDNDLYIVSGGNEEPLDSPLLQDRLYINDGIGNFEKAINALPTMATSGQKVAPWDFDQDGDMDLFVGGRQMPRAYPSPADSYILENIGNKENANFIDVTTKIAPGLMALGMVTDAMWTDYDADGAVDLMVVGEWMPITVFKNNNGKFENVSSQLGLGDSTGWWYSINEGDFDNDGDMDFVVGNLGLNYKYKANEKETFDIYYDDFDDFGNKDIVLSYFNDGEKYPLRGRQCSSQQMPGIKNKFQNYEAFSKATLEDVYTEEYLEKALHYQVKSFASVYLENDGGVFVEHQLPTLAQISSINQILVDDYNNDTHLDVLIVGNLLGSEVETPRNDASNGLLILGNGKGGFEGKKAFESGLFAPGDVKDMAPITIKGQKCLLLTKNNDALQLIRINKKINEGQKEVL